jgi:hypothetical protein
MRARLLLSWCWFVSVLVMLLLLPSQPFGADLGDLLALVPPLSVLIAHLFGQYAELAGQGLFPRSWRVLRWPHAGLLLLLSLALPAFLGSQERLVAWGWLKQPVVAEARWWVTVPLMVALLALLALSIRWMLSDFPGRTVTAWAIWCAVAMTATVRPYARGPLCVSPLRDEADRLEAIVGAHQLFLLDRASASVLVLDLAPQEPFDPALLIYTRLSVAVVTESQLQQGETREPVFVLRAPSPSESWSQPGPLIAGHARPVRAAFLPFRNIRDDEELDLWRSEPLPAATTTAPAANSAPAVTSPAP